MRGRKKGVKFLGRTCSRHHQLHPKQRLALREFYAQSERQETKRSRNPKSRPARIPSDRRGSFSGPVSVLILVHQRRLQHHRNPVPEWPPQPPRLYNYSSCSCSSSFPQRTTRTQPTTSPNPTSAFSKAALRTVRPHGGPRPVPRSTGSLAEEGAPSRFPRARRRGHSTTSTPGGSH